MGGSGGRVAFGRFLFFLQAERGARDSAREGCVEVVVVRSCEERRLGAGASTGRLTTRGSSRCGLFGHKSEEINEREQCDGGGGKWG